MRRLIRLFALIMLVTASEGGINTIFPPYLEFLDVAVGTIGVIFSMFGVMSLAARFPSGALYTGQRVKPLLVGSLSMLAFSTAGLAYPGGTVYIVVLTLIHGFAFGAVTTIMLALTIELKPEGHSHGATMGWYTASISAGYAIGNSLSGYLADSLGYRPGFAVIGSFPLIAAILAASLPRPPASPVPSKEAEDVQKPGAAETQSRWRIRLSSLTPTILLATLVAFYINFLDDAVGTFFPLFGLSIGLSLTTIGALRSAKSLAATSIRPVSGLFFKFVDYRHLNNIAILIWSLLVVFFPGMRLAWIFLLAFISIGLCRGLIRVTSATMVAEAKGNGTGGLGWASGFYNAGLDLGAFVGPIAGGLLASAFGIPAMFRVVPLGLLLAYLLASFLVNQTEKKVASQEMV